MIIGGFHETRRIGDSLRDGGGDRAPRRRDNVVDV